MNSPFIFLEEEKMNSPKTLKRTSFPFFGKGKPHFHFISVIDVYTFTLPYIEIIEPLR